VLIVETDIFPVFYLVIWWCLSTRGHCWYWGW